MALFRRKADLVEEVSKHHHFPGWFDGKFSYKEYTDQEHTLIEIKVRDEIVEIVEFDDEGIYAGYHIPRRGRRIRVVSSGFFTKSYSIEEEYC